MSGNVLHTCRLDDQMRFRCPKRFDEDYYCHLSVAQICHWAGISKRQYDRAMHELEEKVGVVERKLVQRRTEKGEPYFTLSFRLVPVVIREFLEAFQTKELAVMEFDDYGAVTTKKGAVSCRTQKGMTLSTQNSPDPGDCSAPLIDVVDGNEQTLAPEARAGISFCEDQVPDVQRKRINVSPETREIVDILQRATIFDQRLTERQVRKINRLTRLPFAYALTPERASLFADMRRSIRLWVIPESHWVQKVDAEFFCNNWKAVWKVMKRYRHYTDFKRSVNMDEAFDAHGTANHFLLKTFENLRAQGAPLHPFTFLCDPWFRMPELDGDERLLSRYLWSAKLPGDWSHFYATNRDNLISFLHRHPHWYEGFKSLGMPIDEWTAHANWVHWKNATRRMRSEHARVSAVSDFWNSSTVMD